MTRSETLVLAAMVAAVAMTCAPKARKEGVSPGPSKDTEAVPEEKQTPGEMQQEIQPAEDEDMGRHSTQYDMYAVSEHDDYEATDDSESWDDEAEEETEDDSEEAEEEKGDDKQEEEEQTEDDS